MLVLVAIAQHKQQPIARTYPSIATTSKPWDSVDCIDSSNNAAARVNLIFISKSSKALQHQAASSI